MRLRQQLVNFRPSGGASARGITVPSPAGIGLKNANKMDGRPHNVTTDRTPTMGYKKPRNGSGRACPDVSNIFRSSAPGRGKNGSSPR
ncbi:unnamed protein product, partial [Nesidiocoris tenuis]